MTPISISFQDNFLIEEPIGLNNCGYDLNPNNQNDILPFKLTFVSSSDLFSHMVFSDSISISRATIKPEKFFFINPDFSPDQKFFTFKIEGIYNPPTIKTPVVGQKINLRIASETNDENTMTSNLTECPPSWPLKTVYIAAAYSIKNSIHELKIRNYIPFNTEFEDIFLKPIDSIIIKPMVLDTLPQAYKTWHQNFIRRN